jgi:ABC-type glutathione transport system ATPase component/ABC-type dipeptide/oligopeptide/nickel transport system permease subunit
VIDFIRDTRGIQRGMLVTGMLVIVVFVVLAALAHWIAPYGFNDASAGGIEFKVQQAPSAAHWFGTSVGGEDVFSRVVYGARTALVVVVLAVLFSVLVGVPLGLLSGYIGRSLDRALVLVTDAMYAFPSLLLAIVVAVVVSGGQSGVVGGILSAALAITVVFIPQYFRVVRNATLSVKVEPYVDAARVVGTPVPWILVKHIFANVRQTLPIIATLNASEAILTLAGLGFLGFGIQPSAAAEWGYDLNKALSDATNGIWWTGVFPGLAIVLMVLGITLVGEGLNDLLDPRLRTRRGDTTQADVAEIEELGGTAAPAVVRPAKDAKRVVSLSLTDLSVTFRTDTGSVHAVSDVRFDVAPGEVVAVVGESGSGKSVSSRAVLGLLPSSAEVSGSALLRQEGHQPLELIGAHNHELREVRGDQVSMVFQEPSTALNPVYTIGWQLQEGIRAHRRISRRAARARAVELLDLVGLPDPKRRVDYYPHQLSGGQKQRVVIAMAIACDPDVIIADEPTTALDVTVQAAVLELLLELRDRLGTAIVLITHNMGVVADMADRVVVMYRGQIVEEASAQELFASPQHPYTRRLLDAVPHLGRGTGTDLSGAEPVLEVDHLVVDFPGGFGQPDFRAVDDVSFTVHRGEVLGLVGESGSGKSTVGRCIVGLQRPTSGMVRLDGEQVSGLSDRALKPLRSRFGFVFQDPAASLNPQLTIEDCVAEPLRAVGGTTEQQQRARVLELLESVELPRDYLHRYPHELSGGQRQRVSLARSLALQPEVLIADEPTSALDVSVQAKVLDLFAELQRELQFACVFISHDLAVVDMLANRVAVMQGGRIVEIGTRAQVLGDPQEEYTRQLIAAVPVPDPVEQRRRRAERGDLLTDVS